jgi:dolichyl-diphosphooligosaccharide--protein glycosyltransferase/undecaprenyl-diphosphooligosaccharide--protein glycosyltransferase
MALTDNKKTFIYILIAFAFSIAIRLIWVYQFSDTEQFKFNNQFMINTNDGYYWAEGARDILRDVTQEHSKSPIDTAAATLTAIIAKILPFSFETIIFYMSVFFSSLLVIPIILIGKSIDKLEVGFIAALLASIAWSYYNRTMAGYYDTDLLNIVFPTLLLWSLIWAIQTQEDKYLLFSALDIIAYRWWYPQSYALETAFFGLILIYTIYLGIKNKSFKIQDLQFNIALLSIMMFAMLQVDGLIRFVIVLGLFLAIKFKKELVVQYLYYIFGLAVLLYLVTGGFDPIWGKLKGYVFKDHISASTDTLSLHFFTVMQTIREAGQIPFETFANRISGDTITFIASVIGYVWLVFRNPIMLLGLPMVGLGFLALSGGLRFTIYAVPVLALGVGFLIYEASRYLSSQFINDKVANVMRYIFLVGFTIAVLVPNIKHIINYKVPTVFTKDEVVVLDKLKTIANQEDYVVGWWDYGYPIRYYADVKTLSDGGGHSGSINFPTSFALTHAQKQSAKMLRLDVEYTENRFKINDHNNQLDKNNTKYIKWHSTNIGQMTLDYGFKDTNKFLASLNTNIKLPKKSRDVYLYLPNRMIDIYPTINLFSNIDLMTGKKGQQPFFYKSTNFRETNDLIDLGNNIKILKKSGQLQVGKQLVKINYFIKTAYNNKGKLIVSANRINNSNINIVYMSNYHQFVIVDNQTLNSTYFQLFVLENYDKTLFKPIILTPLAKVYKLMI